MSPTHAKTAEAAPQVRIPVGTLVRKIRSIEGQVIRDGHIGRVKYVHEATAESPEPGTYGYDVAWDRMPTIFTPHFRLEIVNPHEVGDDLSAREAVSAVKDAPTG
jgi:hypothetical protein